MLANQIAKNKEAIYRLYTQCLNTGQWNLLPDLIDVDYEGIGSGKGPTAFADAVKGIFQAFPDVQFTVEDLIAEDSKVVVRWRWKAVHKNPFKEFPASHKEVVNNGIAIYEFKADKVIRSWLQNDRLEVLQQIGAVSL